MSGRREKHKRLKERALKAERENDILAELLLLHKPPMWCRIKSKLLTPSPSAFVHCSMGQRAGKNPENCRLCNKNLTRYCGSGFRCGITGDPYPLDLAKEVQRIYEEDREESIRGAVQEHENKVKVQCVTTLYSGGIKPPP